MIKRRKTVVINIGELPVGGDFPILVETMSRVNLDTPDLFIEECNLAKYSGANIQRVAITNTNQINNFFQIRNQISLPVIADIHKDYKLGILAAKSKFSMIRVNPGNTTKQGLKEIGRATVDNNIPVRIGLNSGSLPLKNRKYDDAFVEELLNAINILEEVGQKSLMLSMKDSDVRKTIEICQKISTLTDYPIHIGITEAGIGLAGVIKSVLGIGYLLMNGIGDTIRVSLTDGMEKEIEVGLQLLRSLGLHKGGLNLISCPGCGRKRIDVFKLASKVKNFSMKIQEEINVAVMGCEINGPGEAKGADIGIAGAKEGLIVFKKGKLMGLMNEEEALRFLERTINESFSPDTSL